MFEEVENKNLAVSKIEMSADKVLLDDKDRTVPFPLVKTSGFMYQISAASGMGKTTLLMNIISKRAKKGNRQSYRNLFDDIIFVSPSANTLKNNPLDDLDETKKFSEFNDDVLDKIEELLEENKQDEEDKHTLLILDDVSIQLRKDRRLENRLVNLANNRRHLNLSIIFITQVFNQAPVGLRKNLNLLFIFKPKTKKELNSLIDDYFIMDRDKVLKLFNFVYRSKHDFMIIDFTLRKSPNFEYFRNYNRINILDGSDNL
tara:strand:+ start:500 stop:1276 length:777 start_codon:yes stop_codon:yes gene_type:complete